MKNKLIINAEKLKELQGIEWKGEYALIDCLYYLQNIAYFLKTHNKTYTKEQQHKIDTLADILDCLEAQ